jgi:hypothetical protein
MNTLTGRWLAVTHRGRSWHLSRRAECIVLSGLAVGMLSAATQADNFSNVYYSVRKDQLVVTMAYRGTNPDHTFSLKWGQCKDLAEGGGSEVDAEVLDSQWQDVEQSDFKKTMRFSLASIPCRPAKLTLRSAPRFFYTVQIPARVTQKP